MNIHFPKGGGAEVDGKKLNDRQLGGLVQDLVRRGLLPHYAMGASQVPSVREGLEQLAQALEAQDVTAVLTALATVNGALRGLFGLVADPTVTTARVPTAEDVPAVLRKAARLQGKYPLQSLPAFREPADIEAQARRIEGQVAYEEQLSSEATLVQRNLTAGCQEADGWLRTLWGLCQAAAPTTPGLREESAFLDSFFTEAAGRAQATRQLVERVRSETTQEVKDAVYKQAHAEAKAELRDQLDERFQALLDQ